MTVQEAIDKILEDMHMPLFDKQVRDVVTNAFKAGYALGCDHSASLMDYYDGEYDYATGIRDMCKERIDEK